MAQKKLLCGKLGLGRNYKLAARLWNRLWKIKHWGGTSTSQIPFVEQIVDSAAIGWTIEPSREAWFR